MTNTHRSAKLVLATLVFCCNLFAQESFIYDHGEKVPISISTEKISIKFQSGVSPSLIQEVLSREPASG